jgi:Putative motility protein
MCDAACSVSQAQQSQLSAQISTAVARKALDAVKSQGEAVVALIDAAATIGKAPGRGGQFDGVA